MSKLEEKVYTILCDLYPFDSIVREYYVNYKNNKLFFDFYIKTLNVLIECQGEQHFKYVDYFYKDINAFYAQRKRDNIKVEYCIDNNFTLVYFYDKKDKITKDLILNRIYKALSL